MEDESAGEKKSKKGEIKSQARKKESRRCGRFSQERRRKEKRMTGAEGEREEGGGSRAIVNS